MPQKAFDRKEAIISFYREELCRRYQVASVRRFTPFDVISDETVDALRDYFLDHVYPPYERREQLDDAFDHLGRLLRSPKRLRPMVTMAITSLWRLGRQLPAAVSAGRATFDAYIESRKLEGYMLKEAEKIGLTAAAARDRITMLSLITDIPEKHVHRLIRDLLSLFHALAKVSLLRTSAEIMQRVHELMRRRTDLYTESECAGLALGLEVLRGGLALYESMEPEVFPHIIQGIELVEFDWYDAVRAEVAAARK
ncbi:MAG TPA: hypothetical protein PKI11_04930 [Candidatus Hydrogenedentes bacterium]|nr:hypothetical protein [Candidatus Hydrogenedentota bacterium]